MVNLSNQLDQMIEPRNKYPCIPYRNCELIYFNSFQSNQKQKANNLIEMCTVYGLLTLEFHQLPPHLNPQQINTETESDKSNNFQFIFSTYSGGDPRKLNDVNTISTRCPGPAKKIYKHWRE